VIKSGEVRKGRWTDVVAVDLIPILWHMILQRLRGIFDGTARGKMVLLSMLL
jgi:hypothetical protein